MSLSPEATRKSKVIPYLPSRRELADLDRSIRKSMRKWQDMDETARYLGRGLGRRELIDRVSKETGATLKQVQTALTRKTP